MHAGLPFLQQLILDAIAPPVLAVIWLGLSRGWAGVVQRGNLSEMTKDRQRVEFWIVLSVLYLMMFGITLYHHFLV